MRRILWPLGLAAALLSPFTVRAQLATNTAADSLTLEQALELATSRSFVVSAAQRELEAQDGSVRQAGAFRNPELAASVEDTRSATRTTTTTLNIPLELGGKRTARVNAAQRSRDLAQVELANAKAQVRSSAIAAYFAVLAAQERSKLATNSADLATSGAQAVSKRVAAGKVSPVDATRAQVDQANTQLELAEAQAELSTARHALANLWGDAEPRFVRVGGDINAIPERAPLPELMGRLEEAPALLAARTEVERRKALVDVERSKATPDVTLSVGAKRDNELGRTQAIVGLSIPLPLFDRNQGAVYEANKRADKAEDEFQAARLRVLADLQTAAAQLSIARTSLQTLQSTVLPAAQQAYDSASKGFEAGKFGFLDVIDAQRSLLQARARYLSTLSNAYQAATAIDRLLGR
ncbi:TolC family protein [Roseateles sp. BYS78W]|uniref:TolC family protein n=1 Tax=Pelomonas candidula TaxID=3299025 RepID=A0ABW7HKL9_9BURK